MGTLKDSLKFVTAGLEKVLYRTYSSGSIPDGVTGIFL